jgi:hypothetical protein
MLHQGLGRNTYLTNTRRVRARRLHHRRTAQPTAQPFPSDAAFHPDAARGLLALQSHPVCADMRLLRRWPSSVTLIAQRDAAEGAVPCAARHHRQGGRLAQLRALRGGGDHRSASLRGRAALRQERQRRRGGRPRRSMSPTRSPPSATGWRLGGWPAMARNSDRLGLHRGQPQLAQIPVIRRWLDERVKTTLCRPS